MVFFYYSYISWYSCTYIFHIIDDSPSLPTLQLDGDETAEDNVREPKVEMVDFTYVRDLCIEYNVCFHNLYSKCM